MNNITDKIILRCPHCGAEDLYNNLMPSTKQRVTCHWHECEKNFTVTIKVEIVELKVEK